MAAVKSKKVSSRYARKVQTAKQYAFWQGFAEGFGGPVMLGSKLKVPVGYRGGISEYQDGDKAFMSVSARTVARALCHATEKVMEQKGLSSFVLRQKRLDRFGKMRDEDVVVVKPRQIAYGES